MKHSVKHHGTSPARGCSHMGLGTFGRMFPDLEALYTSSELIEKLGKPGGMMDTTGNSKDSNIPAAYTFFAQLIDHDITLDVTSCLESDQVQEAEKLPNLRSASLDLDCVYGFGPEASPHLYDGDTKKLLTGNSTNPNDLARAKDGTALIGDPRNDENLFVSQLQLVFIRFHNKLIDSGLDFEEAQKEARYHYQYIVLHDFLKRVCDPVVYQFALNNMYRHNYPFKSCTDECGKLIMPVEFSVAAYRFGHSMVRSTYPINSKYKKVELFSEHFGTTGFTAIPEKLTVDWRYLLDIDNTPYAKSREIDELLAKELNDLPFMRNGEPDPNKRSLSFRNLLRGRSLGLPSGQDVAAALADCGYDIDPNFNLKLPQVRGYNALSRELKDELKDKTPLFFYILRESKFGDGLGRVGSAILMEVFGAMLTQCSTSYLNDKCWEPNKKIVCSDHALSLRDIVTYIYK